jgi:hypothetical protein
MAVALTVTYAARSAPPFVYDPGFLFRDQVICGRRTSLPNGNPRASGKTHAVTRTR